MARGCLGCKRRYINCKVQKSFISLNLESVKLAVGFTILNIMPWRCLEYQGQCRTYCLALVRSFMADFRTLMRIRHMFTNCCRIFFQSFFWDTHYPCNHKNICWSFDEHLFQDGFRPEKLGEFVDNILDLLTDFWVPPQNYAGPVVTLLPLHLLVARQSHFA